MSSALISSNSIRADIVNNETLTSAGTIIYSTGTISKIVNNASLTSSDGNAVISAGALSYVINMEEITARLTGVLLTGDYGYMTNAGRISGGEFGVQLQADYQKFSNDDNVTSETGVALMSTGLYANITNNSLMVGGQYGIYSRGDNSTIFNSDRLSSSSENGVAVFITGDKSSFMNSYMVYGQSALRVIGDNANIINSGTMLNTDHDRAALSFCGARNTTFANSGIVDAAGDIAVKGSSYRDVVNNSGKIMGDVQLGSGNDVFDNRGGEVGDVYGGKGNDKYYVGESGIFHENSNSGIDTVYSNQNFTLKQNFERLTLIGSQDVDASGNGLKNKITSNAGDNRLTGLGGADIFIFRDGAGKDVITDFGVGDDMIDFSNLSGVNSFKSLMSHANQIHEHVVIDLSNLTAGLKLTLKNTDIDELERSDFII